MSLRAAPLAGDCGHGRGRGGSEYGGGSERGSGPVAATMAMVVVAPIPVVVLTVEGPRQEGTQVSQERSRTSKTFHNGLLIEDEDIDYE